VAERSVGAVYAAFSAYGTDVHFDPGSFDDSIQAQLEQFNHERISMGERPLYYHRRSPTEVWFTYGDLPAGVTPRQLSPRERLGVEARRMNEQQAHGWPKP
jgi:hypothetical protein